MGENKNTRSKESITFHHQQDPHKILSKLRQLEQEGELSKELEELKQKVQKVYQDHLYAKILQEAKQVSLFSKTAVFWTSLGFGTWMGGSLLAANGKILKKKKQGFRVFLFSILVTAIAWFGGAFLSPFGVYHPLSFSWLGMIFWGGTNFLGGILLNETFYDKIAGEPKHSFRRIRGPVALASLLGLLLWIYFL